MEHLNDTSSLYSTKGDTAATINVIRWRWIQTMSSDKKLFHVTIDLKTPFILHDRLLIYTEN